MIPWGPRFSVWNELGKSPVFQDRSEAGQRLADVLIQQGFPAHIVLGLPRGGVVVGKEIAARLNTPLDVTVARKLRAPFQPELALGAMAEDHSYELNRDVLAQVEISEADLKAELEEQRIQLDAQLQQFRPNRYLKIRPLEIKDKAVVLVDDGLATGATATVALRFLIKLNPKSLILAVPIGASETVERIQAIPEVDEVVCLVTTQRLDGVGRWYFDFHQVSDAQVIQILSEFRAKFKGHLTAVKVKEAIKDPSEENVLIDGEVKRTAENGGIESQPIHLEEVQVKGDLICPASAKTLVIFAHGSGSSRQSPRNRKVAQRLNEAGIATLLMDLLTEEEGQSQQAVFDIDLLTERLLLATKWARSQERFSKFSIQYFGASTGVAAALTAAAQLEVSGNPVASVVSRGGRPDLAAPWIRELQTPVLLIVGSRDDVVLALNKRAALQYSYVEIIEIPGASHLFEEFGALDKVAEYATEWFLRHSSPTAGGEVFATEGR